MAMMRKIILSAWVLELRDVESMLCYHHACQSELESKVGRWKTLSVCKFC